MKFISFIHNKYKVLASPSYKKDVARYLWFIVKGDGTIWEGIEDKNDAKESLKEVKETDPNAKIISRSKMDQTKLAEFFKNHGVPQRMIDKGFKDAKKDAKLGRDDPWA
jgi:hypothetical protein